MNYLHLIDVVRLKKEETDVGAMQNREWKETDQTISNRKINIDNCQTSVT